MSLFNELKRRNVFKVTFAYVIMAWLVMQVADVILNNIIAPGWIFHVLMLFLAIGFPFAVFFAWAFELTPEGLKREHEVDRSQSITPQTGKKLNVMITAVLVMALGYFAYDKFVLSVGRESAAIESALEQATSQAMAEQAATEEASVESDKSIAVLPFVNMSDDASNEYFSDGLSEELLNLLAKIPELRVAARTSSFSLKGKELQISEVGEILKVAHVLEGSVRKAGKQVRITVQLIHAQDGYHLWSETYDRSLDNVFAIQDEIATAVVEQLKLTLFGDVPTVQEIDAEAYSLFLQARHLSNLLTPEGWEQANVLYKKALTIAPDYAAAWAGLSRNYNNLTTFDMLPSEEGYRMAREAANQALAIDPNNAWANTNLGYTAMTFDIDLASAARYIERGLQLEPANTDIIRNAATLAKALGRPDEAIVLGEYVVARDPVNPVGHVNLGSGYVLVGRLDDAIASMRTAMTLSPGTAGAQYWIGEALLRKGEPEAALKAFAEERDDEWRVKGTALALHDMGQQTGYEESFAELRKRWGERWPIEVAHVYAWTGDADAVFAWLEKELEVNGGLAGVIVDPFFTQLHDDPRWQPLLEKSGASATQLAAIEFKITLPK